MNPTGALVPLPLGWGVTLASGTRRLDDGRVLLGGSPLRLLRLSAAGAALVDRLAGGEPVPASSAAQRLVRSLLAAGLVHPRPTPAAPGERATPPTAVAVVIAVHDRAGGLAATLADLATWRIAGPPPVEIVVVDDASAAAERAATARVVHNAGAVVVRHAVNRGPAAARNTGWRATSAPVVAFVDADCLPAPGWLDHLVAHLDDPLVALVAPRITVAPAPGASHWLVTYEVTRSPLDLGATEAIVRPRSPVPYVPATAFVACRRALDAMDGFDEALRVGEDVDLVWRLAEAGWTVRYEPAARVGHPVRADLAAWLAQRVAYGSSAAALAQRHGAAAAPLVISRWSLAAWVLVGLGRPRFGAAVALASTAALGLRLRGRTRRPRIAHPWRIAGRLAGSGHLRAAEVIVVALRRGWWPPAVLAAVVSRRARLVVLAAVVVPPVVEWVRRPPGAGVGPVRWFALRLADDIAYGAGVWVGVIRRRSFAALRPDLR